MQALVDEEFEQFYINHYRTIYGYVYRGVKGVESARDVTQEVFLAAFRKWEKVRGKTNAKPWLYRTATICIADWWRKNIGDIKNIAFSMDDGEHDLQAPDSDLGLDELLTKSVTMDERQVLSAYYQDQKSSIEIADDMHLSISTVKKRLERGRNHLRGDLEKEK